MKISQEVRDFAAKQEAGVLNSRPAHPEEGLSSPQGVSKARLEGPTPEEVEQAEAGMAEMSARYRDGGNELYIGANGREHD